MNRNSVQKVVVTWSGWKERFLASAEQRGRAALQFIIEDDRGVILQELADAEVVVAGPWDHDMLRAGVRLHWVQAMSGGVEGLLFPEFVESPVLLTCLKPIFGAPGAEHALAAMLMFTRRFHRAVAPSPMTQHDEGYDEQFQPVDLEGKTVGILGLGVMGRVLAEKASCLGMRVLALTRTSRNIPDCVESSFRPDELSELAACCDFVVVAVPVTRQTRGMIDESVLRSMKSDAFLIDCSGRPQLFDYHALERAIMEDRIAGVCLQPGGASPEQYIPTRDAPFWRRENVVVSPCRGTSAETERKALSLFFDNLDRFERREPLLGLVDKQAGY